MTSLSILIPTQGRESLTRALESCLAAGLTIDDEVIVIGDTHEPVPDIAAMMRSVLRGQFYVPNDFYFPHDAGHHCWGHCQINHGITLALGDYIVCQDDDDIFDDGALDRIRAQIDALKQPAPLLFRFKSWFGPVFWDTPGIAAENHIGGHCAVFPNDERLGRFTCRYQGDYDYIRSTLDNWGGDDQAVWVDDVIAIARPAVVKLNEVLA